MQNYTKDVVWKAIYSDGSFLWEKDPKTGKENLFKDIDQTKLKEFQLMKPSTNLDDYVDEESIFVTETIDKKRVEVRARILDKEIKPIYKVILDGTKRLVFKRRQRKIRGNHVINLGKIKFPLPVGINLTIIIVGWQDTINGKNVQALNYILPDGRIELAGEFGTDATHNPINT